MFVMNLFTYYKFDTRERSREFFRFLNKYGDIFAPVRYGVTEPVRQRYDPENIVEPSDLLADYPDHESGSLMLKGAKFKYLAWITWGSGLSAWHISIDDKYFDQEERIDMLIHFTLSLCDKYQIVYGYAGSMDDWEATHWVKTPLHSGGTSTEKVQYDMQSCLPAPSWLTIYGEPLLRYFGTETIKTLPAYRIVDTQQHVTGVILHKTPFHPEMAKRLQYAHKTIERLGEEYFFDVADLTKVCKAIPGVTPGGLETSEEAVPIQEQQDETETVEDLESRQVLMPSPDSFPYTNPEELAGGLPIYMQEDAANIDEVMRYTRSALKAVDAHFATHVPKKDIEHEFLLNNFTPTVGAFLGEVLIHEGGGKWLLKTPIMKSRIAINGKIVDPFWIAYQVIFNGTKLLERYDETINGSTHT